MSTERIQNRINLINAVLHMEDFTVKPVVALRFACDHILDRHKSLLEPEHSYHS